MDNILFCFFAVVSASLTILSPATHLSCVSYPLISKFRLLYHDSSFSSTTMADKQTEFYSDSSDLDLVSESEGKNESRAKWPRWCKIVLVISSSLLILGGGIVGGVVLMRNNGSSAPTTDVEPDTGVPPTSRPPSPTPEDTNSFWIQSKPVKFHASSDHPEGVCSHAFYHAYRLGDFFKFLDNTGGGTYLGSGASVCYQQNFAQSLGACYALNVQENGNEPYYQIDVLSQCVVAQSALQLFGPVVDKNAYKFSSAEKKLITEKTEEIRKNAEAVRTGNVGEVKRKAIVHVRTGDVINEHPPTVDEFLEAWQPEQLDTKVYCYVYPRSEFEEKMRWPAGLEEVILVSNPNHRTLHDGVRRNQKSLDYLRKVRDIVQKINPLAKVSVRVQNATGMPENPTLGDLNRQAAEADEDLVYAVLEGEGSYLYLSEGGFSDLWGKIARDLKSIKVQYGGAGIVRYDGKIVAGRGCEREPGWPELGWEQ